MKTTAQWTLAALPLCVLLAAAAQFPKSVTEPAAVDRGSKIWAKDCASCHGSTARGTATAPDMLRSLMVLHDRRENLRGKELAPYLKNTGPHHFDLNTEQTSDLSQFLSSQINHILRSGYDDHPKGLTSGDAKAGAAYFNGDGGCVKCHSVTGTGDLAHIGSKYTTATLQQKIVFPSGGLGKKAVSRVKVRMPNGEVFKGELVKMDDFVVTFKDADGRDRSVNRVRGSRVTVDDPYAQHVALLDRLTDTDMHNLTTYLDGLK